MQKDGGEKDVQTHVVAVNTRVTTSMEHVKVRNVCVLNQRLRFYLPPDVASISITCEPEVKATMK